MALADAVAANVSGTSSNGAVITLGAELSSVVQRVGAYGAVATDQAPLDP